MASRITVRFFQIICAEGFTRSFAEALRDVSAIESLEDRTRNVNGTGVRLENFIENHGLLKGQVIRIQTDNLPAEVLPNGMSELDADSIGFGTAFVFDEALSILAIQYDNRIISPNKLGGYLKAHGDNNRFNFLPVANAGAWDRFEDSDVKNFRMKIATPGNFDLGVNDAMAESMSALIGAYEAPYITIEMGVGHKRLTLTDAIKDTASHWMGSAPVISMRARTVEGEIDLMEEMLKSSAQITIPADPQRSYEARIHYVTSAFIDNREYLANFGPE